MKKKILFLAPSLSIGGAERVMVNLLKEMDYDRYEVSLCLYSNKGVYYDEIPDRVKILYIFNNDYLSRIFTYLYRKIKLTYILQFIVNRKIKEYYDVGISTSDGTLTDVLLFTEKKIKNKISWVHSCYKSQPDLASIYTTKKVSFLRDNRYRKLNNIIFVSENSKREFEELFGKPTKLHTIHNIFDSDTIKSKAEDLSLEFDNEVVNLVAIGRLVEVKQYEKLIKASAILATKEIKFKLRIIGDGKQSSKLKSLASELKVINNIDFLGFQANPYPYLKKSDILVLTSTSESLPTVLIEAMTLGIPIVATKCSGAIEISDHGNYALLTEHTIEDIAEKIIMMISDQKIRNYYILNSKKRLEYYNTKKVLTDWYQIIDQQH